MRKKVYLHIGTHKTGSTAIQKSLEERGEQLKEEGFGVLKLPYNDLYYSLMNYTEYNSSVKNQLKHILDSQIHSFSKCHKFILSAEILSGNADTLYLNQEVILTMIKDALIDYDIEVIVFFRRQDEFLQSLTMQAIHQGNDINANFFLRMNHEKLDYLNFINGIKSVFEKSEIHVFPYDRCVFEKMDIIKVFNVAVQSKILENIETPKVNVGFSSEAKDFFQKIKDKLSKEQEHELRIALQETSNKGLLKEYSLLDNQSKRELLSQFQESNKELARRFWFDKFGLEDFSGILPDTANAQLDAEQDLKEKIIVNLLSKKASKDNLQKIKDISLKDIVRILYAKTKRKLNMK